MSKDPLMKGSVTVDIELELEDFIHGTCILKDTAEDHNEPN